MGIDVAGSWGVVRLTGFLEVDVGRYKGISPATAEALWKASTTLPGTAIWCYGKTRLEDVHQRVASPYYHNIHPGNFLQDQLGNYHLIRVDFSLAQRANECSGGTCCDDMSYLDLPSPRNSGPRS